MDLDGFLCVFAWSCGNPVTFSLNRQHRLHFLWGYIGYSINEFHETEKWYEISSFVYFVQILITSLKNFHFIYFARIVWKQKHLYHSLFWTNCISVFYFPRRRKKSLFESHFVNCQQGIITSVICALTVPGFVLFISCTLILWKLCKYLNFQFSIFSIC